MPVRSVKRTENQEVAGERETLQVGHSLGFFPTSIKSVKLAGAQIRHFPTELLDPVLGIIELDLENNLIEAVPPQIGLAEHLQYLCLDNNLLNSLPIEILQLRNTRIRYCANPFQTDITVSEVKNPTGASTLQLMAAAATVRSHSSLDVTTLPPALQPLLRMITAKCWQCLGLYASAPSELQRWLISPVVDENLLQPLQSEKIASHPRHCALKLSVCSDECLVKVAYASCPRVVAIGRAGDIATSV